MKVPVGLNALCPLALMMALSIMGLSGSVIAGQAYSADGPDIKGERPLLEKVVVTVHNDANSVGGSDAASQGAILADEIASRPELRPGEVLEFVPGLVVTQHSGDGKANQYFLRGFNLDHGTDLATTLDGMPVNMPTHAHGQGYSDLNFLIPELVDRIDYRKGPYFAPYGDFSAAGAADIFYKNQLPEPLAQITLGQNAYRRGVTASSFQFREDLNFMGAFEWMTNDGPWSVPEDLQRKNAVLRLTEGTREHGSAFSVMAYEAHWNSTDQVPQRLIDSGYFLGKPFGRFDAVDPTDGGNTSRYSVSGEWHDQSIDTETKVSAYAMKYTLKLFSNFTYAMDRPTTGDQFSQQDDRNVFGGAISRSWNHTLVGLDAKSEIGVQLRNDRIDLGLYDTEARSILSTTRLDHVNETMLGVYGQSSIGLTPWLRGVVGLRADRAHFGVTSLTHSANSGNVDANLLSPKLTLVAGPWNKTEFFFNSGNGFHSNDARGTTERVDPKTGESVGSVPGLVVSRGWELGVRTEVIPNLQTSLAYWQLTADSELVYEGDSGTTDASNASKRQGIEINTRWTASEHFLVDMDLAFTHARFTNGDRIPNALDSVGSVAFTLKDIGRWSGSLRWRYLGSGALIEDNSVRSDPVSMFNLRISRSLCDFPCHSSSLTLEVFNLLNTKANDIEYYYASQLPGEPAPVNDKIVHPAEPRTFRVTYVTHF